MSGSTIMSRKNVPVNVARRIPFSQSPFVANRPSPPAGYPLPHANGFYSQSEEGCVEASFGILNLIAYIEAGRGSLAILSHSA